MVTFFERKRHTASENIIDFYKFLILLKKTYWQYVYIGGIFVLSVMTVRSFEGKQRKVVIDMTNRKKVELKRVNVNLPVDLVNKVVEYGDKNGLNTTSAYIVLLNQGLSQIEMINSMPTVLELLKNGIKIDTGGLEPDELGDKVLLPKTKD